MWSPINLGTLSIPFLIVFICSFVNGDNSSKAPLQPLPAKHPGISEVDLAEWPPKNLRFIKTGPSSEGMWMDVAQVMTLMEGGGGFMDMTDVMRKFMSEGRSIKLPDAAIKLKNKTVPIPTEVRQKAVVRKYMEKIDMDATKNFLKQFTSFHTRFYWTDEAAKSSDWLMDHAKTIVAGYKGSSDVYTFTKKDPWKQKSVFVRLEGRGSPSLSDEVIILGSHIDTINLTCVWNRAKSCETLRSPGADDNGSGTAVLMEILRIFVENAFVPKRTIEFHWYTAEEVGCRGSIAMAIEYWKKEKNVVGALNIDAVGYAPTKESKKIGLQTRGTYEPLVQFVRDLADTYLDISWLNSNMCESCGSDFVSWTELGYPAANLNEVIANPYMHTQNDTIDHIDFDYLKEYVKLGLAYAIEHGEPLSEN